MKGKSTFIYVFSLVGIGMIAGSYFWYINTSSFLEKAIAAEGTVVDLVYSRSHDSSSYFPVLSFSDRNGREIQFQSSSGSNPPSYSVGERVEILYLPDEPTDATINDFFSLWGGSVILGGMGLVFFSIGAGVGGLSGRKRKKQEYLKQNGIPIRTDFQSVEVNKSMSFNGRHPFRVVTQWQDPATSKLHIFQSNNLWFDPSRFVNNDKITVYIERNNPKKYYVDLSFLPKMAD